MGIKAECKVKKIFSNLKEELREMPPTRETVVIAKKKIKTFLTKCVNEDLIIEETNLNYLMSSGSIGPAFSSNSFVKT